MNVNFQVTGNDRRLLHKQYLILFFPRFQKQKNLTDYDALVASSKQFKKSQKNKRTKQWYSCFEKKFLVNSIA